MSLRSGIVVPSRVRPDTNVRRPPVTPNVTIAKMSKAFRPVPPPRRLPPSGSGVEREFQITDIPGRQNMLPVVDRPNDQRNFVHKRILGGIGGFLSGGPGGAIGGFLGSGGGRGRGNVPTSALVLSGSSPLSRGRRLPVTPVPGFRGLGQRLIPGGATGLQVATPMSGNGCPSGFHPNKTSYMTQGGFVQAHSKCVKNRRRNLSNGRANTRSLRRLAAWDKQERKLSKTMKAIARGR